MEEERRPRTTSLAQAQRIIAQQEQELERVKNPRRVLSESEIWQDLESKGLYRIVSDDAIMATNLSSMVVYASLFDGQYFVMPRELFHDGRFMNLNVDEVSGGQKDVE